jgi:hypothetical protein
MMICDRCKAQEQVNQHGILLPEWGELRADLCAKCARLMHEVIETAFKRFMDGKYPLS